jgi:hypothetical protein
MFDEEGSGRNLEGSFDVRGAGEEISNEMFNQERRRRDLQESFDGGKVGREICRNF